MRYFEKFTKNSIEKYSYEVDEFIDYLYDLLMCESREKLAPMILNLTSNILPTDLILYEESKKINAEIIELIKLMPYNGYLFDEIFFKEYNLLVYEFLNNNNNFKLDFDKWFLCSDLQYLLKKISVFFLTMIKINTKSYEFYTDEGLEYAFEDTIDVIKLFNEVTCSTITYDLPNDFNRRYNFLRGEHYDYFLKHQLPTLFKLLSYTTSNIYISKLNNIQATKKDIIYANFNEFDKDVQHKFNIKSYRWISKLDIKMLYKILYDKDLLISGTSFRNFQQAFNDKIINKNYEKIKFNILSDSEVLYLITNLMEYNLISRESSFSWKRFYKLFDIKSTSLKNSKKGLDSKLAKPKKDIIIDIIKSLK